jgi:hypothetical protein
MTKYVVKIAFWLRAFDSVTIEAKSDAEAIEKAKVAATAAMESTAFPEHIDTDERREGVIAYIDRIAPDGHSPSSRMSSSTTTASTVRPPADPNHIRPTRSPAPRRAFAF